jgi:hypothetical protein
MPAIPSVVDSLTEKGGWNHGSKRMSDVTEGSASSRIVA